MAQPPKKSRYTVSDIGCGYAVHDTQVIYQRLEGEERGEIPPSTNELNSRIVDIFPTRMTALRRAQELNREHERQQRAS